MKPALIATAVILIAAAWLGQKNHQRLATARQENERILAEARLLGIDPADLLESASSSSLQRASRTPSADRDATARDFAARLARFVVDMKQREKDGTEPDEDFQKQLFEFMDEMLRLDAGQLKVLIDEIRNDPQLDAETRSNIVGFAVMMLANDHPAKALALFTESAELFDKQGMGEQVVSSALARLAHADPDAALAWIREHGKTHPGMVTERTKQGLLRGVARRDPLLAFQLIAELGIENPANTASQIASTAQDAAGRTAVLDALRKHIESLVPGEERHEILSQTIGALASRTVNDGFDSAVKWFDSVDLSKMESGLFFSHIGPHQTKEETGRWIEWMSGKLEPEAFDEKINHMVGNWALTDYQAAGGWLRETPAGPVRNAAVKSYAETIAPHHPESAREWANTLPPGPERDALLRRIDQILNPEPFEDAVLPPQE